MPKKYHASLLSLAYLLMQWQFIIVGRIWPSLAGRWALKRWLSTRRFQEPKRETHWRRTAHTFTLTHPDGPLMLYRWGEENSDAPKVLLMHGWNGRATQMGAFIAPLLAAGYQVIGFDAPAHGRTPGNSTNVLRITDALNTVIQEFSPVESVIAHSFGAVVVTYALQQKLKLRQVVCISAPAQMLGAVQAFCRSLRLPKRAQNNFFQRINACFGADIWSRISPLKNVATLSIPALVVHDKNDTQVPFMHGESLVNAWSGAHFLVTNNLGHQRILRHPPTIELIVSFLKKNQPI